MSSIDELGSSLLIQVGNAPDSPASEISAPFLARRNTRPTWEQPGWASVKLTPDRIEEAKEAIEKQKHGVKLNQWQATAICGNDITSSCFYSAGLVTTAAGYMSPFALIIVSFALHLLRGIYGEVVSAIPLNGGCYTLLLNTTSKSVAAVSACLGILSYLATSVVSAAEACEYLASVLDDADVSLPVKPSTIALLLAFAILCFFGLTESANVSLAIFLTHLATLTVLCTACLIHMCMHPHMLKHNFNEPLPDITVLGNVFVSNQAMALFFGSVSAMLGVTGFETSAQFVEEQAPGVFPKTLRNMWVAVTIFNPLIGLLALGVLPQSEILANSSTVLAKMGQAAAGKWLRYVVSIDAFIVLSGSVLTAYVGVVGLIRRMAMDRCLPTFLLEPNSWRGTCHYIIFGFFLASSSLYLILNGSYDMLAKVYSFAFLAVLSLYSIGCVVLKYKRPHLPRPLVTSATTCLLSFAITVAAMVGVVLQEAITVAYFLLYFGAVLLVVQFMFCRVWVLKVIIRVLQARFLSKRSCTEKLSVRVAEHINNLTRKPYVFFTKNRGLATINKAILYVRDNELTSRLIVVHMHNSNKESNDLDLFAKNVELLNEIYPKLQIDLLVVEGDFTPESVYCISQHLEVPQHMMFITCPTAGFSHPLTDLGGVRVITQ